MILNHLDCRSSWCHLHEAYEVFRLQEVIQVVVVWYQRGKRQVSVLVWMLPVRGLILRSCAVIQIKGVLEVRVIVFRFAKFEGDKGDKVIRILECPLDGCRNASGSGPWVSSK